MTETSAPNSSRILLKLIISVCPTLEALSLIQWSWNEVENEKCGDFFSCSFCLMLLTLNNSNKTVWLSVKTAIFYAIKFITIERKLNYRPTYRITSIISSGRIMRGPEGAWPPWKTGWPPRNTWFQRVQGGLKKAPLKSPVRFNTWFQHINIIKHRWWCTVPGYMIDNPCSVFD